MHIEKVITINAVVYYSNQLNKTMVLIPVDRNDNYGKYTRLVEVVRDGDLRNDSGWLIKLYDYVTKKADIQAYQNTYIKVNYGCDDAAVYTGGNLFIDLFTFGEHTFYSVNADKKYSRTINKPLKMVTSIPILEFNTPARENSLYTMIFDRKHVGSDLTFNEIGNHGKIIDLKLINSK